MAGLGMWRLDTNHSVVAKSSPSARCIASASLKIKSKGQVFSEGANKVVTGMTGKDDVCRCDMGFGDVAWGGQLEVPTSLGNPTSPGLWDVLLFGLPPTCRELSRRDTMAAAAMVGALEQGNCKGHRCQRVAFDVSVAHVVKHNVL